MKQVDAHEIKMLPGDPPATTHTHSSQRAWPSALPRPNVGLTVGIDIITATHFRQTSDSRLVLLVAGEETVGEGGLAKP